MEYYLILARSITHAQRMQRTLQRAGLRAQAYRAPRDLTNLGCAYVLRIGAGDLTTALVTLHHEQLQPVQIFLYQQGAYREVGP